MSKKICRTCLKWACKTYKTHESLHYAGEKEQLKISDMLRHLVPELYLGVTVSPEICEECKLILRSAYAFRKKCLVTENLIGTFLKKSRCTAASIELVAVLPLLKEYRKQETTALQGKAQEIISDWDDDGSQDLGESNESSAQTSRNSGQAQKELTLSPDLGVFVDQYGNCYNADGISIAHPEAISNTQSDFIQISEVFSLNEDEDVESRLKEAKPPEEKPSEIRRPRLTVIPEAKLFSQKRVSNNTEAKTESTESIDAQGSSGKSIVTTVPAKKNVTSLGGSKSLLKPSSPTMMPIIVDVRSESDLVEDEESLIATISPQEITNQRTDVSKTTVKEEPMETESSQQEDDEETLSASETNSNYENIQGIIDNIPDTYNNHYVDVPEFVHINNFSLKDLEELKQQTPAPSETATTAERVGEFSPVRPFSNVSRTLKSLPNILPKPGVVQAGASVLNPAVLAGTKRKRGTLSNAEEIVSLPSPPLEVNGSKVRNYEPIVLTRFVKKCIHPICPNSSDLNPKKIFVTFPTGQIRRNLWFKALKIPPSNSPNLYVCEDHFDLPDDIENWMQVKMLGSPLRMKIHVVPHKYINEHIPLELIYKSQLNDEDISRYLKRTRMATKVYVKPGDSNQTSNIQKLQSITESVDDNNMWTSSVKSSYLSPKQRRKRKQEEKEQNINSEPSNKKDIVGNDLVVVRPCHNTEKVGDKQKDNGNKYIVYEAEKLINRKSDDTDVCVLFTNYTSDGYYINDHDYLITPYKRNKILHYENNKIMCKCYICGNKHLVHCHVRHMMGHTSYCMLCKTKFGTSYMLNMHVKDHFMQCSKCDEIIPYGEMQSHQVIRHQEFGELDFNKPNVNSWFKCPRMKGNDHYKEINEEVVSDLEGTSITHSNKCNDAVPQSNETVSHSNQTSPESKETVPQSNETVVHINKTVLQSNDTVLQSNETVPQSNEKVLQSNETVVKRYEAVPQTNEPVPQKTVVTDTTEKNESESKCKLPEETRLTLETEDTSKLSTSQTSEQHEPEVVTVAPRKKRKFRSREVEPIELKDDDSPRVLRSRQKRDNNELTSPNSAK